MSEDKKTQEVLDEEEIIVEEIVDEDFEDDDDFEDDEFLKSLEAIEEEENEAKKKQEEEEQRIKNKNAEEARKRREAEAKAKQEAEEKAKQEEEKPKEESEEVKEEEKKPKETSKETPTKSPQEQVKELVEKYPDLDLGELDKNQDFQEYLQGKWYKGGKNITEIYEDFVNFKSRVSNVEKEVVEKEYRKKGTPSIKSSGGGSGSNTKKEDIYSQEEIQKLGERLPFMSPQEYARIEAKLEKSINYYKTKS